MSFTITGGKGFQIQLANNWKISVQFGRLNYCINREYNVSEINPAYELKIIKETGRWSCANAEIAVIDPEGKFVNIWKEGDEVMGYSTPDDFTTILLEVSQYKVTQTAEDVVLGVPRSRADFLRERNGV